MTISLNRVSGLSWSYSIEVKMSRTLKAHLEYREVFRRYFRTVDMKYPFSSEKDNRSLKYVIDTI